MRSAPQSDIGTALQQSEQVRLYVADELPEAARRRFETLLLGDAGLQTLVEAELALRACTDWPAPQVLPRAPGAVRLWQWAAAAVLLLGGGLSGYTLRGPVEPRGALAWVALGEARGGGPDPHRVPADTAFAARLLVADQAPVQLELRDLDGRALRRWTGVPVAADGHVTVWIPALPAGTTHVLRRTDAAGARQDYALWAGGCPC